MKWHGNLLYVRDLTASLRFYIDVLGLPLVARPAHHLAIIALENGVLYLHEGPADAPEWLTDALASRARGVGIDFEPVIALQPLEPAHVALADLGVEHRSWRCRLGQLGQPFDEFARAGVLRHEQDTRVSAELPHAHRERRMEALGQFFGARRSSSRQRALT